jgi:hypothetical protein
VFTYDANGNQIGWERGENGTRRTLAWNEENRLRAVSDNGRTSAAAFGSRFAETANAPTFCCSVIRERRSWSS